MSMQVREFEERDAGQVARIMFESFRTFLGERMEKDAPESEAYWIRCSSGKTEHSVTRSFVAEDGAIRTQTNHAGGILGGISSGMPILFRAAFKPTPSIAQTQHTVRLSTGTEEDLQITGRHDPCIVPRAVPVVEAVTALVLLDALLDRNVDQI